MRSFQQYLRRFQAHCRRSRDKSDAKTQQSDVSTPGFKIVERLGIIHLGNRVSITSVTAETKLSIWMQEEGRQNQDSPLALPGVDSTALPQFLANRLH